jgi:tRNA(Arg) A34 adenosine deaminase TadA
VLSDDRTTPLAAAAQIAVDCLRSAPPYSTAEYFAILLARAVRAVERGDYGIAAAVVIRSEVTEVVSLGLNSLITRRDPAGHAEMNALHRLVELEGDGPDRPRVQAWEGVADALDDRADLLVRPAPSGQSGISVYATLEPCPMCTVGLINAGATRIVIAIRDPVAGALAPERLERLAPLWPSIARGRDMQIEFVTPQGALSLPPSLHAGLEAAFAGSRAVLDRLLRERGVFVVDELTWRASHRTAETDR